METNLIEKINKKIAQIEKLERLYLKYTDDAEEKAIIDRFLETGDRTEYKAYLKATNQWCGSDAWSKANDLYDARNTLAKYQKMLETETAKNATLNQLPEALVQFKENLIKHWNEYDEWKYNTIRAEYAEIQRMPYGDEHRKAYRNMSEKWGRSWHDFAYHYTLQDAFNNNRRDANNLILNLINRVSERVGTIINAAGLRLDRDNAGYSIINGRIIGTNGECRIESIGAGGYNIQRYHIRVLVH